MSSNHYRWFLGAGVASAFAASLCCIGPVIMLGLGLGGFAASSWFAGYRPWFLVFASVLLAAAWILTLWRRKNCKTDGACTRNRSALILLSITTLIALSLAAYPWLTATEQTADATAPPSQLVSVGTTEHTAEFGIPTMDCAACATMITSVLTREDGVISAEVTYATKRAIVLFDPTITDRERIRSVVAATGFPPSDSQGFQP